MTDDAPEGLGYTIAVDDRAGRINVVVSGFWNEDIVARFTREMFEIADTVRARHGGFDLLIDSRQFIVQGADVAERLREAAELGLREQGGRTATVVGSILNKMQAERALTGEDHRVFLDIDEAQQWLDNKSDG